MSERVWLYIISKELSPEQLTSLSVECTTFVNSWTAHEQKLNGAFEIHKNRLLIFKVDESVYNASGCSIDKLTRLVQSLEKKFSIELLNRLLVGYEDKDAIKVVHSSKIKELLESGMISENTLIYDITVSNSAEFKELKKPLKNTWLNKYLPSFTS